LHIHDEIVSHNMICNCNNRRDLEWTGGSSTVWPKAKEPLSSEQMLQIRTSNVRP